MHLAEATGQQFAGGVSACEIQGAAVGSGRLPPALETAKKVGPGRGWTGARLGHVMRNDGPYFD